MTHIRRGQEAEVALHANTNEQTFDWKRDQKFAITFGAHSMETVWSNRADLTWDQLCGILTRHEVGEKAGRCFVPATLCGLARKTESVTAISLVVLDLDRGDLPLGEVRARLEMIGWAAIIYSTHSHCEGDRRWRVVAPLAKPWQVTDQPVDDFPGRKIAKLRWRQEYRTVASALGLEVDEQCLDLPRLYYLGRHAEGAPFDVAVVDGEPCSVAFDASRLDREMIRDHLELTFGHHRAKYPDAYFEFHRENIACRKFEKWESRQFPITCEGIAQAVNAVESDFMSGVNCFLWPFIHVPDGNNRQNVRVFYTTIDRTGTTKVHCDGLTPSYQLGDSRGVINVWCLTDGVSENLDASRAQQRGIAHALGHAGIWRIPLAGLVRWPADDADPGFVRLSGTGGGPVTIKALRAVFPPCAAGDDNGDDAAERALGLPGTREHGETSNGNFTPAKVAEMLRHILPDINRVGWLKVMKATIEALGDSNETMELLRDWSSRATRVDNNGQSIYNESMFEIEYARARDFDQVGPGTLVHMARAGGWCGHLGPDPAAAFSAAAPIVPTYEGGVAPAAPLPVGAPLAAPPIMPAQVIRASPFICRDPASIPRREWLYGRHLIRRFVSLTVAPGATGKSSLLIGDALALVTDRDLIGTPVYDGPKRVWVWNLEDPRDELERRIVATMFRHHVQPEDIGDRLFLDSGRDQELCIARQDRNGATVLEPVVDALVAELVARRIDVLIIDPFVSSHSVSENDNGAIDAVAKTWGKVAERAGCAIELVHHLRKLGGAEATAESARGAVALTAAARSCRVLQGMTGEEAVRAGLPGPQGFFRAIDGKPNLAPAPAASDWYHLDSVTLPNGDNVGVVVPWQWPNALDGLTVADLAAVQEAISGKNYREDPRAKNWVGHAIADVLILDLADRAMRSKVAELVKTWIKAGALTVGSATRRRAVTVSLHVPRADLVQGESCATFFSGGRWRGRTANWRRRGPATGRRTRFRAVPRRTAFRGPGAGLCWRDAAPPAPAAVKPPVPRKTR